MKYLALALLLLAACGDTTQTGLDQLNLDRPVDMAFACYGGLRITNGGAADPQQPVEVTPQPIQACDVRSGPHGTSDPVPVPPGQEDLTAAGGSPVPGAFYYGFILQSSRGTVAVAQWETKPSSAFAGGDITMLDSDPLTPGKNGISVGEDPIAIATDQVGCYEVIANAGSCDLSVLEVKSALESGTSARVDRLDVKSSTGRPVHARPAAMAMQAPGGTIGVECPAQATGIAYIAYPSCHLVAAVDTSTGTIVSGIQYDASGVPSVVTGDVSCPDECAGGAIVPGTRPVALDLELDPRTDRRVLAIGADNSASLAIVELDANYLPQSLQQVALLDTTTRLGVTSVAITPQIGMGGTNGVINDDTSLGGQSQFVYAVANDNTVRVADILTLYKECDAQVDPRYLHDEKNVHKLSCLPVGDAATPPRRVGARGPGIELTGDAIPTSIDVFRIDPIPGDATLPGTPTRMIGYFGVVTAANGNTYLINVDNDDYADYVNVDSPIGTAIPLDIAHQVRDGIPDRGALAQTLVNGTEVPICDTNGPDPDASTGNSAGPRAAANPTLTVPAGTIAAEKVGELPNLHLVKCVGQDETKPVTELSFAAPLSVREAAFPDLRGLVSDENWTLTWEGSLSLDSSTTAVDGPAVREGQIFVDSSGMRIVDATRPFCDAGVETFDAVQLRGCDPAVGDAGCPIGYTCYVHPESQVAGLGACMLADEADRLANACREFLISSRRYTVGHSANGELVLLGRKHVLRTTPLGGCTSDSQCQSLATYAATNASSANPGNDPTMDNHTWTCAVDPDRAPLVEAGNTGKRCIETCTADADCIAGYACQGGYCMEGVVPPQACVNAPQRFELHASEAFAVVGNRSGYVHPIVADAGGNCVRDAAANPFQVGRIPLVAPACDPAADPRTGKRADGTFEPDPCQLTVDQTEFQPNYIPGTCTAASPAQTLVTRAATAIRFRNRGMQLTFVDPTYPGDGTCIGDRLGTMGDVPIVPPGYQLTFRQTAGLAPLRLPIQPSLPIKVTRGPGESIWVIDEGDYLSTSLVIPSTSGKVFRVESPSISVVNILQ